MDVKQWLLRAYRIDQQIQSKNEQIEMWETLAQKVTSDPSALPGGGGGYSSRVETYCIKIADSQAEIERQRDELISVRREIEEAINKVQNVTLRLLLEQRYLLCKGWEDIAEFMGYCVEYVKRDIHRQALRAAREIIAP